MDWKRTTLHIYMHIYSQVFYYHVVVLFTQTMKEYCIWNSLPIDIDMVIEKRCSKWEEKKLLRMLNPFAMNVYNKKNEIYSKQKTRKDAN